MGQKDARISVYTKSGEYSKRKMGIKKIKCPRLNEAFRRECINTDGNTPNLEVVVWFGPRIDSTIGPLSSVMVIPTAICCDEYDEKGVCSLNNQE